MSRLEREHRLVGVDQNIPGPVGNRSPFGDIEIHAMRPKFLRKQKRALKHTGDVALRLIS